MVSLRMGAALGFSLFIITAGCSPGVRDENAALRRQNQELAARVADLERSITTWRDPAPLAQAQAEIAQRDARVRELEQQLRAPAPAPAPAREPGIEGVETSYDRAKGEMTVQLPSDILFAAGSAQLKASAKTTLDKVIAALKRDYAGRKIRVEGHTDPDPIARSKTQWIDNLDLSLNRAAAVTRYLVEKRIDEHSIITSGFGAARPKPSKAASRRVEIVVLVR